MPLESPRPDGQMNLQADFNSLSARALTTLQGAGLGGITKGVTPSDGTDGAFLYTTGGKVNETIGGLGGFLKYLGSVGGNSFVAAIQADSAGQKLFGMKMAATPTANPFRLYNSADVELMNINTNGGVEVTQSGAGVTVNAGNGCSFSRGSGANPVIGDSFNTVGDFALNGGIKLFSNQSNWLFSNGAGNLGSDLQTIVGKSLVNNTTTTIFTWPLSTLDGVGGTIVYRVWAKNATDVQCRSGVWRFSAVNKGGVYTTEIVVVSEALSASTGTLTGTWSITTGSNLINLRFNGNSSITPTTLYVSCELQLGGSNGNNATPV